MPNENTCLPLYVKVLGAKVDDLIREFQLTGKTSTAVLCMLDGYEVWVTVNKSSYPPSSNS